MRVRRPPSMTSKLIKKFPIICFGVVWLLSVVQYVWLLRSDSRGEVAKIQSERRATIATSWMTETTLLVKDCNGKETIEELLHITKSLWVTSVVFFPSCESLLKNSESFPFNVVLTFSPLLSQEELDEALLPPEALISAGRKFSIRGDVGFLIDFTSQPGLQYARKKIRSAITAFDSSGLLCIPADHILLGKQMEKSSRGYTTHELYSTNYYQTVLDIGRELSGLGSYNFGTIGAGVTTFGTHTDISPLPAEPGVLAVLSYPMSEDRSTAVDQNSVLSSVFLSTFRGYDTIGYPWSLEHSPELTHPYITSLLPSQIFIAEGTTLRSKPVLDSDVILSSELHSELSLYFHSASSSDNLIVRPLSPLKSELDSTAEDSYFLGDDLIVCPPKLISRDKKFLINCRIPVGVGEWTFFTSNSGVTLSSGTNSNDWMKDSTLNDEIKQLTTEGKPLILKRLGTGIPLLTLPGGGSPGLWNQYGMTSPTDVRVLTIVWDSPTPVSSTTVIGGSVQESLQLNYTDDGTQIAIKISPHPALFLAIRKVSQPPPYVVSQFGSSRSLEFLQLSSLWDVHSNAGSVQPSYFSSDGSVFVTIPAMPRGITLLLK